MTVPLTAKQITLSRSRKVSPGYSISHQWFDRNVMKRQEYFLYRNKTRLIQKSVRSLRTGDNRKNGTTLTQRRCYSA